MSNRVIIITYQIKGKKMALAMPSLFIHINSTIFKLFCEKIQTVDCVIVIGLVISENIGRLFVNI